MALRGITVVEFAGLAPGPYCGLILADLGARVVRIDNAHQFNVDRLSRGKLTVALDIKKKKGVDIARKLCNISDALIDPFRPGVMERFGLGPKEIMEANKKIIYARLSGYGQHGSMSQKAGHDINYLAISGVLSQLKSKVQTQPTAPQNILADFAGGGLLCALGIVVALFKRTMTGLGQVIDLSMVEGSAYLGSFLNYMQHTPIVTDGWLDGSAHFYTTYKTKDGKYLAVGAIEGKFYEAFLAGIGLDSSEVVHLPPSEDSKKKISKKISEKTRDEWAGIFENLDACVTPVLTPEEAANHPHNLSRKSFRTVEVDSDAEIFESVYGKGEDDNMQRKQVVHIPRPPLFSGSPPDWGDVELRPSRVGSNTVEILESLGYGADEIHELIKEEVVYDCKSKSKL